MDFAVSSTTCPASGKTLAGNTSCTINVTFTPQTTGAKKGALIINDSDPSSPQFAGLSGTGTSNVVLAPSSIAFRTQPVGATSAASKITLTNSIGKKLSLGSTALTITGPFAASRGTTRTNKRVIAVAGTCIIYLTFTPTATGFPAGSLSVSDSDVTSPQTAALSGVATGVKFASASLNLGTVSVGTQESSTVTITNVGATTINFSAGTISGTNQNDFSTNATDPPCNGLLIASAACTFTVYFVPAMVGAESATYQVFDNSPGSPQTLTLSGTGQ